MITSNSENNTEKQTILNENMFLKNKIIYSIGSLETINYILNDSENIHEMSDKKLEHLKTTINRALENLRDIT
jgi:hypothetical protein